MALGLGYMEYFQLAEDLKRQNRFLLWPAVLCQARSDYANPAGGKLQEKKYIKNFNRLDRFCHQHRLLPMNGRCLRRDMGHEEPFGLHYLVSETKTGARNFFASFEEFKHAIDVHMEKKTIRDMT